MKDRISEGDRNWADQVYEKILKKIQAECARMGNDIPYIPEDGRYSDYGETDIAFWTNGFWGGILWQLYQASGDEALKESAIIQEERLDRALEEYTGLHHDVGFMWQGLIFGLRHCLRCGTRRRQFAQPVVFWKSASM